MNIHKVHIKGFRNFKDTRIKFAHKSLVIGCNDVGKSNLLYALRLLLDRSLSEDDLVPRESDFYVHDETNEMEVTIFFEDIKEECVISKLREYVSDNGTCILKYKGFKKPGSRLPDYKLYAGKDDDSLAEIQGRFYLKVLNLKFIGSKRDLTSFIKRERAYLIQDAKSSRQEKEIEDDTQLIEQIKTELNSIDTKVKSLSYITKATDGLNGELKALSHHNTNMDIIFDTGASEPEQYIDNLQLASKVNGRSLLVGGDGRNNQIHLALWSARNNNGISDDEPIEVNIYCIEEPEAHLHPHQQRKLAKYLSSILCSQVIITTHSPQITCEFPPDSIIRLYDNKPDTLAAGNGVNPFTEVALIEFGYRFNIIPAEAFFASVVFLVEGVSEELFYKALAKQINIDLDKLNISVLFADGIGFKPYVSLLNSLMIPFVIRTDNDIIKVPYKDAYRFAGIQRMLDIYKNKIAANETHKGCLDDVNLLQGFPTPTPLKENIDASQKIINALTDFDVYVANKDLEHDLHDCLGSVTRQYFGETDDATVVREMQKRKGITMFEFLQACSDSLSVLQDTSLAKPLIRCKEIVEAENKK